MFHNQCRGAFEACSVFRHRDTVDPYFSGPFRAHPTELPNQNLALNLLTFRFMPKANPYSSAHFLFCL